MDGRVSEAGRGWLNAWPDLLAFGAGLTFAWFGHWQTRDLVWSLWLSSLLVGMASIVWGLVTGIVTSFREAEEVTSATPNEPSAEAVQAFMVFLGFFLLVVLVGNFGGFHLVHSVFLNLFFPIEPGRTTAPGLAQYQRVFQEFWLFVLVIAVAERRSFRSMVMRWDVPDTGTEDESATTRKFRRVITAFLRQVTLAPYLNVIRMHLLLFFFAFMPFVGMNNFLAYIVVYALYFLPGLLRKEEPPVAAS